MNDVPASESESILVIGYGNTLRGDDGLGRAVAETIAGWNLPHVRVLSVHQLTPELADDISASNLVIFADARQSSDVETVSILPLELADSAPVMEHSSNPRTLIALAHALFGKCPPAWRVTLPGICFEFADGLSPRAEREMNEFLRKIASLFERQFAFLTSHDAPCWMA
jgi:hydrogenase maturation protease